MCMTWTKWRHLFEAGIAQQLRVAKTRHSRLGVPFAMSMSSGSSHGAKGNKGGKRSSNRFLKVVGTGGSETPPSFYLFTDSRRYLFNCGPNTERLCLEHRLRFGRVEDVFLTRPAWACWGGLAGLAMGMRTPDVTDSNQLEMNLYGPEDLHHYRESIEHVMHGEKIVFKPSVLSEDCAVVYSDDEIQVTGVKLQAGGGVAPSLPGGDDSESEQKRKKLLATGQSSIVYLTQLADIPGRFDNVKAKSLGLKPGPLYNKLVQGETVAAPNGAVVQPSDVLGPPFLGPVFVLVDCPNEAILSELLTEGRIFDSLDAKDRAVLVAHVTPRSILERDDYQEWMTKFGLSCRHLLVHESVCAHEFAFRRSLKIQAPLNVLSPSTFPIPQEESSTTSDIHLSPSLRDCSKQAQVLLVHHFYPSKKEGWDDSGCLAPLSEVVTEYLQEAQDSLKQATKSSALLSKVVLPSSSPTASEGDSVVVTLLGTGSAVPSKYRTVTCILLEFPTGRTMLLDCGEGSLAQLHRCYGDHTDALLRSLSCVFVSHMHGDHNMDIIRIAQRHRELRQGGGGGGSRPLLILGPTKLGKMLSYYSSNCEELDYLYAVNYHHRHDSSPPPSLAVSQAARELGLQRIRTVIVDHSWDAYGIVLDGGDRGGKIVFSGDTRPCSGLVELGKGAKLLIHEATFEDELKKEAVERKHCTMSEALEVAASMQAEHTILTHFSQRAYYPKVPPRVVDEDSKILIAFDCMRIGLGRMGQLSRVQASGHKLLTHIVVDTEPESGQI